MSADLLITGASGFIGGRLCDLALEQGRPVRSLTRRDWPGRPHVPVVARHLGWLPHGIPPAALEGVRCVVHCAALTGAGTDAEARAINVDGTLALAEAARRAGARRFIFLSSQSAREDAPSAYGRTKHAAEQALLRMADLDVVIVRPGLVCGQGSRGLAARMAAMVRRLPVLPLLGGGRALVQPIHVDDLGRALLTLAADGVGSGATFHLGDPQGLSLRDFLDALAKAEIGRSRPRFSVPLAPFIAVATVSEAIGLKLPVTKANLQGLSAVERMETRADMERLGVPVRDIADILRREPAAPAPREGSGAALDRRSVGILLVGAGRIGLAHSITASRRRGAHLAAMVDTKPGALGFLRALGVTAPTHPSLDAALDAAARAEPSGSPVDAVIIATPAVSHLPLARRCVERGLATLVEKPLAATGGDLAAWQALGDGPNGDRLAVGYLSPRAPHAAAALERLRRGDYGKPLRYLGLTLLSFIEAPGSKRWEVDPARSGGGVLANAGGHVLSLVTTAFGEPTDLRATFHRRWSDRVEDSAMLHLEHGEIRGRCLASWSIAGFPRQENTLVVVTDRGVLSIANDAACFEEGGRTDVLHQLDFDVGFNLFPEYAGGGLAAEQEDLIALVRRGERPPMGLAQALAVERVLARATREATLTRRFEPGTEEGVVQGAPAPEAGVPERCLIDVRDVPASDVVAWRRASAPAARIGFVASASAAAGLHAASALGSDARVTVPDFSRQARLLATGQAMTLLREMGPAGAFHATAAAVPAVLRERGPQFWAAAEALLGASLGCVPHGFPGVLLLHPYLVDLALGVDRPDRIARMLAACRRRAPRARVGLHTHMAGEIARLSSVGERVEVVHALSSPSGLKLAESFALMRRCWPGVEIVAEVGPALPAVHRAAARAPEDWRHSADLLLLGPSVVPALADGAARHVESAWAAAFPGLPVESVLR